MSGTVTGAGSDSNSLDYSIPCCLVSREKEEEVSSEEEKDHDVGRNQQLFCIPLKMRMP